MATFAVTLDNGSVITFEGNLTGDIGGIPDPVTSTINSAPATDEAILAGEGVVDGSAPLVDLVSQDTNDNFGTAQRFFRFRSADGTVVAELSWIADLLLKTPVGESPPAVILDSADSPLSRVQLRGFFNTTGDILSVTDDGGVRTISILANGWILAGGFPTGDQMDGETLWVDEAAANVVKRSSAP